MIVECEQCHAKFGLDESLLKKTGSKVRCSICKHKFIVFPPKTEPVEEGPPEPLEEPGAMPPDEDKTILGKPLEEPVVMVSDLDETLAEEIEAEIGREEEPLEPISFEDLSQLDSGLIKGKKEKKEKKVKVEVPAERAVAVEEELRAEDELQREEFEEVFKPHPIIKKSRRSGLRLAVLVIILILIGIVSLMVFKPGFLPGSFPFFKRPLSKEEAFDMGNRRLRFKDLSGSFVKSKKAGKLFMVKGMVINDYPDSRSHIRIRSNVLDSKGKVVKSKIVFAGNPISNKEIASMSMEEIDNRLKNRLGKDKMNTNVHPKSSIPFMIFFDHLPEDMSEFTVEPISSSPAEK